MLNNKSKKITAKYDEALDWTMLEFSICSEEEDNRSFTGLETRFFDTTACLIEELGPGPMRFVPSKKRQRTMPQQLAALDKRQAACYFNVKKRWETKHPDMPFTDEMYLRFCRTCPSKKPFVEKATSQVMKNFDHHYLSLTAEILEPQLATKTLFPVPRLRSKKGHEIFYMRPCRFSPQLQSTDDIIDNLAYVMQSMNECDHNATKGLGFIANMNDWQIKHFSMKYCYRFMTMLQGHTVAAKVTLFLIVNPPTWFGNVWKLMKAMLAPHFRRKVHIIPESKLTKYLMTGFENFLPDELSMGTVDTDALVRDFICYRKRIEYFFSS